MLSIVFKRTFLIFGGRGEEVSPPFTLFEVLLMKDVASPSHLISVFRFWCFFVSDYANYHRL